MKSGRFISAIKIWSEEQTWWFSTIGKIFSEDQRKASLRLWIVFAVIATGLGVLGDRCVLKPFEVKSQIAIAAFPFIVMPVALFLANLLGRLIWSDLTAKADAQAAAARTASIE
jgi:hypothetical protein